MRSREFTTEASYSGNIGMMEVAKFYRSASDAEKTLLKNLMSAGKTALAWQLIQKVTGVQLQGAEFTAESSESSEFMKVASDFIPWIKERLGLEQLPEIEFLTKPLSGTFGNYQDGKIRVVIAGRHPVDVLRTLAHELIHYTQDQANQLKPESGATGSSEENEANAEAGIVMRNFSQEFPDVISDAIPEAKKSLRNPKDNPCWSGYKPVGTKQKAGKTVPNCVPVDENFADGKKPGRKGLAKRSGVNCKASVSSLRKTAKNSSGEKQRMAHWCANMKSGNKNK